MCPEASSSHGVLCFILFFAQCCAMFPVSGIANKHHSFLHFSWTYKRTIYSMGFAFLAVVNVLSQIVKIIRTDLTFNNIVTLVFYSATFTTAVLFIDLARKWPRLMAKWAKVDDKMALLYGFPTKLHRKLIIISIIIMSAAAVEHTLFIVSATKHLTAGDSIRDSIDLYFESRFGEIFEVISYNICFGILEQLLNLLSTISWNFMDLFIILISLCLSSRFNQVFRKVKALHKIKARESICWRRVREDYTDLTCLCLDLDDAISNILLLSFGNNLFVVLVQLYNSLSSGHAKEAIDQIYFVYSFTFLILRTTAVTLFAATVNIESKKPGLILSSLSTLSYNIEITRFLDQVKYDPASLTSHKMFKITRSTVLGIAGALVSYELVLYQFLSR